MLVLNSYFDKKEKKYCNGCGTCALRCPKGAITMVEDSEGFLYPVINESKCIHCGLCKKVCSNNPTGENIVDSYIAINNNKEVLSKSSSGGMFSVIADYVIEKGGIVYGVTYNEKLDVVHDHVEKKEELKKFQYSKYVRSDLKNSYVEIEKFLKENRYVLFTGTPCQCAGLRLYLKKDYDKLITCEIICHSNASPKIFNMYKKNVELTFGSKIKQIIFRYKKYGWHGGNTYAILEDGREIEIPEFTNAFLDSLIGRPSCHNCKFCTIKRYSDFTIGDFWGIEKVDKSVKDDNTGISLLCVNTDKGKKIFEYFKKNIFYKKVDTKLAFSNNHHENVPFHSKRQKFFDEVNNGTINESNIAVSINNYLKRPLYKRVLSKCKKILKRIISN